MSRRKPTGPPMNEQVHSNASPPPPSIVVRQENFLTADHGFRPQGATILSETAKIESRAACGDAGAGPSRRTRSHDLRPAEDAEGKALSAKSR